MVSLKTSNNPGTLKTLNNVWKNFDHCWNYMMNLNNFFKPREYPMAAFWNSYLDIIQTLRDFIKSIKNGD